MAGYIYNTNIIHVIDFKKVGKSKPPPFLRSDRLRKGREVGLKTKQTPQIQWSSDYNKIHNGPQNRETRQP